MSTTTNVLVLIPAPLRRYTGGEAKVSASGATVAELLTNLDASYPGIRDRIVENAAGLQIRIWKMLRDEVARDLGVAA